ncbi:hypothetical protein [Campylobacter troglodytis]|nr:hypothetical protein [Campylobacter troglodytis]
MKYLVPHIKPLQSSKKNISKAIINLVYKRFKLVIYFHRYKLSYVSLD